MLLVIAATGVLSWLLTAEMVAMDLAEWIKSVAHQPWQFLLMLNFTLLLLGIFIEPLPAMLLSTPLLLPMAQAFGIDMVHFGVVMTANLSIALYTPPGGRDLVRRRQTGGAGIGAISQAPDAADDGERLMLFVITYVPSMTRVIVWLFMR